MGTLLQDAGTEDERRDEDYGKPEIADAFVAGCNVFTGRIISMLSTRQNGKLRSAC